MTSGHYPPSIPKATGLLFVFFDHETQHSLCFIQVRGIKHRTNIFCDGLTHLHFRHITACILLKMELASLPWNSSNSVLRAALRPAWLSLLTIASPWSPRSFKPSKKSASAFPPRLEKHLTPRTVLFPRQAGLQNPPRQRNHGPAHQL